MQEVADILEKYDNSEIGLDEIISRLRKMFPKKITCQTCGEEVPVIEIDKHMKEKHFDSN